jgi:hypothetical protein
LSSPSTDLQRLRGRILAIYDAVTVLMLLGIAVLIVYAFRLGPLTSPGAEQSFGYAVALMFLMAALVFHLVDRTYRAWPLGRRIVPTAPGPVTVAAETRFVKVLVVVVAAAAIAYILGGLIA